MRSTYKSDLGWAAVHSLCLIVLKIIGSKSFAGRTDGEGILFRGQREILDRLFGLGAKA